MIKKTTKPYRVKMYNIESISAKLIENITDLFDELGIEDYQDDSKKIVFACPIHNGDRPNNSSILKAGCGNWKCFSESCHEKYGNVNGASIVSFVQAVLSQEKKITFYQTLKWCANFVHEEDYNPENVLDGESKTQFIQLSRYINREKNSIPVFTPRKIVKTFLKIPAEYYLRRGYGEKVLHKFDIGYCFSPQRSFFDRIVTPFYDDRGEYMIGASGRNKNEQCPKCHFYHNPDIHCPITKDEKVMATKWKHTSSFAADSYLYNYWNAKKYILDSHTVILVEGPGDVWRLEEAGIYNSLGLLGARLSTNQQIILEQSGAINIIVATDNDEAGKKAFNSINNNCRHIFNIKKIEYPTKDPGSLTIEQVKEIFIPILERV